MTIFLPAALLLVAAPAVAAPVQPPAAAPAATPAVDPQRLALARVTVDALFPIGTSARMIADMMSGSAIDRMLDLSPPDLGIAGDKAPKTSLRTELKKSDPYFEQRMTIVGRVIGEEMTRLAPQIETPLRDGLAESVARRFSIAQLGDINRFFATDSGKAFGRELWLLWMDPAVVKGIIGTMPVMIKEMPAVMKKVEAATAHLPKPKTAAPKPAADKPTAKKPR
jgi:hypothetical protein